MKNKKKQKIARWYVSVIVDKLCTCRDSSIMHKNYNKTSQNVMLFVQVLLYDCV